LKSPPHPAFVVIIFGINFIEVKICQITAPDKKEMKSKIPATSFFFVNLTSPAPQFDFKVQ
jgi:hypothetical protein